MAQSDKVEKLQTSQAQKERTTAATGSSTAAGADSDTPIGNGISVDDHDEGLRTSEANSAVKNHVIASMGLSLVPIPIVDLVGLSGVQIKMVHSLAKIYRVPFSENMGKSLIASLVGGVMPTSTAMTLASFAKAVPGLGTAAGMVSVSILGGATTYAIGSVFMQHFESGGTLLDFDPKTMRDYFSSKLQEGKNVAANLKRSLD